MSQKKENWFRALFTKIMNWLYTVYFKTKNWFFFFDKYQKDKLNSAIENGKWRHGNWLLLTIVLPLAPFLTAVSINFIITENPCWGTILNNGSLPIISYGFITSGILFLFEDVEGHKEIVFNLRIRVIVLAILLLFFNSSTFVFQTTQNNLDNYQQIISTGLSIIFFWWSFRISQNMFLLQTDIIVKSIDEDVREKVIDHGKNWEDE